MNIPQVVRTEPTRREMKSLTAEQVGYEHNKLRQKQAKSLHKQLNQNNNRRGVVIATNKLS